MKSEEKGKGLVPRLRFPEFRGEWRLGTIAEVFLPYEKPEKATHFDSDKILTVKLHVNGVVRNERTSTLIGGANYFKRRAGQFIFSKIDLLNGAFGIIPDELDGFFSSSDVPAFSFNFDHSPTFFVNWFASNYRQLVIERTGTSATLKRVSPEKLMALPIPLPTLPEQQRIADCLSSLDDLISAEGRKLEALRVHKKGLMQQLFPAPPTSPGTPLSPAPPLSPGTPTSPSAKKAGADAGAPSKTVPRLRFPEFEKEKSCFEQISKFAKVTTGDKDTQNKVDEGQYPFFVRSQKVERINSYSYDGEAVLTSGDGVGVGENYHYVNGRFSFHQRVYCIYEFSKEVNGRYFFYYFSQNFKKRVRQMSAKNSVDSVRMAMITKMPVWLPKLQEQQRIADCLSSLDDLIAAQARKVELLKQHKKGLMQQLFPKPEEVGA